MNLYTLKLILLLLSHHQKTTRGLVPLAATTSLPQCLTDDVVLYAADDKLFIIVVQFHLGFIHPNKFFL